MTWTLTLDNLLPEHRPIVGGKAMALAGMIRSGIRVPRTLCLLTDAYDEYVDRTGLRERIQIELSRKDFKDMRWEEVWDCASRIRHLFIKHELPQEMSRRLTEVIHDFFSDQPVAVRSSALDEDAREHSFAGLHESYLNVRGTDAVLEHIRKVWASLWSDAALLYRSEIGLDAENSSMAVILQETIPGDRSGVIFTRSPNDVRQCVVESVYGLNPGLVDGTLAPDRWTLDRETGRVLHFDAARRTHRMHAAAGGGLCKVPLSVRQAAVPPLTEPELQAVYHLGRRLEAQFQAPQDIEWTFSGQELYLLQSRPITTSMEEGPADKRGWYLSLRRSFENLELLRVRIEGRLIPEMVQVADALQRTDLSSLSNDRLAEEIRRRADLNQHWVNVYWTEFIPYAHGMRLFGRVYNDTVKPEDPYEFVELLAGAPMLSLERNRMLTEMAAMLRKDPHLVEELKGGRHARLPAAFAALLKQFVRSFGDLSCSVSGAAHCDPTGGALVKVLLELASRPESGTAFRLSRPVAELEARFLEHFDGQEKDDARQLLQLARSSYRLRDDDNIHLARIEAGLIAAIQEGKRRIDSGREAEAGSLEGLHKALVENEALAAAKPSATGAEGAPFRYRQLLGQPAGPGVARGAARVVREHGDLVEFSNGEILVCDAVDPNMTFVVPLAAGIVERRGGMLIHGAIIAREYGLPCVTGVPEAANRIRTGDMLTVDGFLGIVTLD
jgi:pyruvate,water dikinase